MEYPDSNKKYFVENIHGYDVEDSYRWLEDFTSEESLDWVKRQNEFTNQFIENSEYKKPIAEYLSGIWDSDSQSTPFKVKEKTYTISLSLFQNSLIWNLKVFCFTSFVKMLFKFRYLTS